MRVRSVELTAQNRHRLDHCVQIDGEPELYIRLRLIVNGDCAEVELVLYRQAEMSAANFKRDAEQVQKDLAVLQELLAGGDRGLQIERALIFSKGRLFGPAEDVRITSTVLVTGHSHACAKLAACHSIPCEDS